MGAPPTNRGYGRGGGPLPLKKNSKNIGDNNNLSKTRSPTQPHCEFTTQKRSKVENHDLKNGRKWKKNVYWQQKSGAVSVCCPEYCDLRLFSLDLGSWQSWFTCLLLYSFNVGLNSEESKTIVRSLPTIASALLRTILSIFSHHHRVSICWVVA